MNIFKLITISSILLSASCSTKKDHVKKENHFNSGLDQIEASIGKKVVAYDFMRFATAKNLEVLLKEEKATFVVFGMVSNDYSAFEKKYGVKVKTENCVITPGISQLALVNNQLIAGHLQKMFEDEWKNELKMIPFGL